MRHRKPMHLAIAFSLALVAAIIMTSLTSRPVMSGAQSPGVVIFHCNLSLTSVPVLVMSASNSADAPTVSAGTGCAQALAYILGAGFKIKQVSTVETVKDPIIAYTLLRGAE